MHGERTTSQPPTQSVSCAGTTFCSIAARDPNAAKEYEEMLASGSRHGETKLTRKDGSEVAFFYRAAKTVVAGIELFVAVGFLDA